MTKSNIVCVEAGNDFWPLFDDSCGNPAAPSSVTKEQTHKIRTFYISGNKSLKFAIKRY